MTSLNAAGQMLAGSFTNVADSKPNSTGLWDCDDEDLCDGSNDGDSDGGWVDTGSRHSLW